MLQGGNREEFHQNTSVHLPQPHNPGCAHNLYGQLDSFETASVKRQEFMLKSPLAHKGQSRITRGAGGSPVMQQARICGAGDSHLQCRRLACGAGDSLVVQEVENRPVWPVNREKCSLNEIPVLALATEKFPSDENVFVLCVLRH